MTAAVTLKGEAGGKRKRVRRTEADAESPAADRRLGCATTVAAVTVVAVVTVTAVTVTVTYARSWLQAAGVSAGDSYPDGEGGREQSERYGGSEGGERVGVTNGR